MWSVNALSLGGQKRIRQERIRPKRIRSKGNPMKKIVLDVKGMHCDSCVRHVKNALSGTPGVTSAHVSLDTNKAEVEFDEGIADVDQLIEQVQREGYDAVVDIADTPRKSGK